MIPAVSLAQQKVYGSQLNSAQNSPVQSSTKANVSFGSFSAVGVGLIALGIIAARLIIVKGPSFFINFWKSAGHM